MDVTKFKKEELYEVSEKLSKEDIELLISNLSNTNDKVRYPSFLIIQYRSENNNDIYPYWDKFINMLKSDNSYFRTIGLKLLAINTKWDKEKKFNNIIDDYLSYCEDEKMITARLAIQGLKNIIDNTNYDEYICNKIVNKLISIDISKRPQSNLKVMTTDIVNILIEIEKKLHYKDIIIYLSKVIEQNIIDKSIKKIIDDLIQ